MEYVIGILRREREVIVADLKNGKKERLGDLQQVDHAIDWLSLIRDNHLDKVSQYQLEALPYIEDGGGFSCYRIMVDQESDCAEDWEEYKRQDGEPYLLSMGDFLLVHK